MREIIVDNFAGGGGASTGIEMAIGQSVDIAIDYDPDAIRMHKTNHPGTVHHCKSVWDIDPVGTMTDTKVTSYHITSALAEKHHKEFFATEVKNGPTYNPVGQGLLKFDAMAIYKSWTSPCIVIYEVKVSRSDFLRDGKYHLYKQYCHEFYFVVPSGMVKKEEIPDDIGLMYYDPETKAIRTVKKALYRKIDISPEMLMYIIMNKLDSDRIPFFNSRAEWCRAYLDNKKDNYILGMMLGTRMAREIVEMNSEVNKLRGEADRNKQVVKRYDEIIEICHKHGITEWHFAEEVDKILTNAWNMRGLDLSKLSAALQSAVDQIREIEDRRKLNEN